jgi:hypothetical protein
VACTARQYFFALSHKLNDFWKKVTEHNMRVFILFTTFVRKNSHSKKNWARYDHNCIMVFMWSTRYSFQTLMKLEFSRQIFEKYSSIKFHENPSSGSKVVACGQTDGRTYGQTDLMMLIVAFRNFANAPKNFQCALYSFKTLTLWLKKLHNNFGENVQHNIGKLFTFLILSMVRNTCER